jgi:hypothetical protein
MKTKLTISYRLLALVSLTFWLSACAIDKTVPTPIGSASMPVSVTDPTKTFDAAGQALLVQGAFMNGVHTVSGNAKVYEKSGKRTLVFSDFKTDGGPDLRIYVAEDAALTNFVEVSRLTATGSFFLELPETVNPLKQRTVIIWCKQYGVFFGSATLK